jgi:hypothetical protein
MHVVEIVLIAIMTYGRMLEVVVMAHVQLMEYLEKENPLMDVLLKQDADLTRVALEHNPLKLFTKKQ